MRGAHEATQQLLGTLQGVLRDDRLADSRVVVVTRRAVATQAEEDVLDLAHAPLWGLVRSAQTEHPGRLGLLDIDTLAVPEPAWQVALAERGAAAGTAARAAVRAATGAGGAGAAAPGAEAARGWIRKGTVLITGGPVRWVLWWRVTWWLGRGSASAFVLARRSRGGS